MSKEVLKSALAAASKGKAYPIIPLVRNDPEMAAMLSKLIPGREPTGFKQNGDMKVAEPNFFELQNVAEKTARNITDAETVLQMLPETEMAATILTACVLSPKDMLTVEVTYGAPEGMFPPETAQALNRRLTQYFETDYNIKPLLPVILKDVFLNTGSYPVAVLPENSIDEVINNNRQITMENLREDIDPNGVMIGRNLLGNAKKTTPVKTNHANGSVSLEAYENPNQVKYESRMVLEDLNKVGGGPIDCFTTVIDNPSLLKIPQINQKLREQRVTKSLGGMALEREFPGLQKLSDRELKTLLYKSPRRQYKPIDTIQTQERLNRRTVGSPLIMHLPSESVIPVYVPGNVKQHVGYFVLIDQDGNPLVKQNPEDIYSQLGSRLSGGGSFASAMLAKVQMNTNGFNCGNRAHLNYSAQVYGQMVESDLLSRLRNGIYANGVALANRQEVYRIMLARALSQQHTQLLYLPIELMTYFAFKFSPDGIGRSILDEMKILSSMRSMLTFANTMAAIKNSIGKTAVEIKLDETDPDPQKTIERYLHEIARTRQQAFPIGVTSPVDLTDYMQRAQFEFSFTGHPRIPETSIQFTEKNTNYVKVDTELEEDLKKRSIQKFGLPPSVIDAGMEAEFATSIVTNNILTSKLVIQIQDQFIPLLEDHHHKVAMNDERLIKDLRKIIEDHYDKIVERLEKSEDYRQRKNQVEHANGDGVRSEESDKLLKQVMIRDMLDDYVMGFTVTLPRPSSVSLANQLEAFDKYMEGIDKALDFYVSTAMLNSATLGDLSTDIDTVKEIIKARYARKWMAENGLFPELAELTTTDEDGKPVVNLNDEFESHINSMAASVNDLFKRIQPIKKAANVEAQARADADTTEGGAAPTTNDITSTSSDTGTADPFGMGGGFGDIPGLDNLDTGLDETKPEGENNDTEGDTNSNPGGDGIGF